MAEGDSKSGPSADRNIGAIVADRYVLERVVGVGAMGTVYEATHVDLDRRVAVKLVHPSHAESDETIARFRREARAAGRISSEFIVQVYDVGRDKALGMFLATEFLEGEDLEQRLAREHRLGPALAVTIAYQVARGLTRAHAMGVVHRDLKPANIFLTMRDDGSPLAKIVDFGISKLASCTDAPLTDKGTAIGTPHYMAPEQLEGSLAVDGRADLWSLSACLYEMLSGQPPFGDREGYLDIMIAIARDRIEPLHQRAPWVPSALSDIVSDGLERDPALRIPDAVTMAERLRMISSKKKNGEWMRQSGTMKRVPRDSDAPDGAEAAEPSRHPQTQPRERAPHVRASAHPKKRPH